MVCHWFRLSETNKALNRFVLERAAGFRFSERKTLLLALAVFRLALKRIHWGGARAYNAVIARRITG
jgi:hypothetical protein